MTALWVMFSGAFLAATLLPGGSEVLLLGLLSDMQGNEIQLLIMASIGNTLGAMTSFLLGRAGRLAKDPQSINSRYYQSAVRWIEQYGVWALLLSWLPIVGDLLCVLAGWVKLPLLASSVFILIGKTIRYSIIVGLFMLSV